MKSESELVDCVFCSKQVTPLRAVEGEVVQYRCPNCNGLVAAYGKDYEEDLKFGRVLHSYQINSYKPNVPSYVKQHGD